MKMVGDTVSRQLRSVFLVSVQDTSQYPAQLLMIFVPSEAGVQPAFNQEQRL